MSRPSQRALIRNLYPSDIFLLFFPKSPALFNEVRSGLSWYEEKFTHYVYKPFLGQWLVPGERRFSWVYIAENRIHGLLSAMERATSLAWEIDYLLLSRNKADTSACLSLLEALILQASRRKLRKVYLRCHSDNALLQIIRKADFNPYLKEYLFYIEGRQFKMDKNDISLERGYNCRLKENEDDEGLYQLLYQMQPALVRNAESVTFKEWKGVREKNWRGEKELVVKNNGSIVGWLGIRKGSDWGHFRVRAYLSEKSSLESIFIIAFNFLKNKRHIYCIVREYQEELKRMLEGKGFERMGEFSLAVKDISITEKEPSLVSMQA